MWLFADGADDTVAVINFLIFIFRCLLFLPKEQSGTRKNENNKRKRIAINKFIILSTLVRSFDFCRTFGNVEYQMPWERELGILDNGVASGSCVFIIVNETETKEN